MTFHITHKHLLHGMPRSGTCCPAVLAIEEQLPASSVTCNGVHFFIDGSAYHVSPELAAWQDRYDGPERHRVGPTSFELRLSVNQSCEENDCPDVQRI